MLKKSVNIINGFFEQLLEHLLLLLVGFKADHLEDLVQSLVLEFATFAACGVAIVLNGI